MCACEINTTLQSHAETIKAFVNKDLFIYLKLCSTSRYTVFDVIVCKLSMPFSNCNSSAIKPRVSGNVTRLWPCEGKLQGDDWYTGCHRRNGPNFGRMFLMLNYTDITQNTYNQSWTVTEIMAREVWNFDSFYTLVDYQIHIETGRNMWFL